jgi:hypothetical protein
VQEVVRREPCPGRLPAPPKRGGAALPKRSQSQVAGFRFGPLQQRHLGGLPGDPVPDPVLRRRPLRQAPEHGARRPGARRGLRQEPAAELGKVKLAGPVGVDRSEGLEQKYNTRTEVHEHEMQWGAK